MAIDFPNSPTTGERFSVGNVTWIYDGSKWNISGSTTAFAPIGTVIAYTNPSPPNGWLKADGSSVLRSTYPGLFGIIGTTFGEGSVPGTTFSLPNYASTTGIYIIRATDDTSTIVATDSLIGVPVGTLQLFATATAPTGWLRANGAAVSRTGYADLFGSIGTTYGSGDGSTTFNLPNLLSSGSGSPVYFIKSVLSGDVEPSSVAHAASHVRGGTDIIDSDRDQIDFVPTYYTRDSSPVQAGAVTDLTAHLKGVDNMFSSRFVKLGNFSTTSNTLDYASIPQTYTHLKVIGYIQTTRGGFANTGLRLRWNGYSANYNGIYNATSTLGSVGSLYLGQCPAGLKGNNNYVLRFEIMFPDYSGALIKTMHGQSSGHDGTNVLGQTFTGVYDGGVAGISSISIFDDVGSNLGPNCAAELFGII